MTVNVSYAFRSVIHRSTHTHIKCIWYFSERDHKLCFCHLKAKITYVFNIFASNLNTEHSTKNKIKKKKTNCERERKSFSRKIYVWMRYKIICFLTFSSCDRKRNLYVEFMHVQWFYKLRKSDLHRKNTKVCRQSLFLSHTCWKTPWEVAIIW